MPKEIILPSEVSPMFLELKLQSANKYRINNSGATGISQTHTVSGDRLFMFILYWSQDLLISWAD